MKFGQAVVVLLLIILFSFIVAGSMGLGGYSATLAILPFIPWQASLLIVVAFIGFAYRLSKDTER